MLNYKKIENQSAFMEGFEVTLPDPLTVKIGEGVFRYNVDYRSNEGMFPKRYEEFEFDVEPDAEVEVVYDVYLLQEPVDDLNIAVERTEMAKGVAPYYQGDGEILHTLMTFIVPPSTANLQDVDILIRVMTLETEEGG